MELRTLVIGGVAITVASEKRWASKPPFSLFLVSPNRESGVSLTLSTVREKPSFALPKVFDSGTTWSLYSQNSRAVMSIPSDLSGLPREACIYFNRSFQQARMVLGEAFENRFFHSPLEYPFSEVWMIHLLPPRRGLLVHCFGLLFQGGAYLFVGSSGEGKTTSAKLWQEVGLGEILSDDRVIVKKENGTWMAYGTPWHGEARLCSPHHAPLKKIFFLAKAGQNRLKPLSPVESLQRLLVRSFHPFWNLELMEQSSAAAADLCLEIPSYELGFLPDKSAVQFILSHLCI